MVRSDFRWLLVPGELVITEIDELENLPPELELIFKRCGVMLLKRPDLDPGASTAASAPTAR